MVNHVVDVQSDGGTQCFPMYLYDEAMAGGEAQQGGLFDRLNSR